MHQLMRVYLFIFLVFIHSINKRETFTRELVCCSVMHFIVTLIAKADQV